MNKDKKKKTSFANAFFALIYNFYDIKMPAYFEFSSSLASKNNNNILIIQVGKWLDRSKYLIVVISL